MESWQVSIVIGIITYISIFVTLKNKTEQNSSDIKDFKTKLTAQDDKNDAVNSRIFAKLDSVNQEIAEHKVRLGNAPTMEQVRADFVTKEMFKQMEKHIDEKFDKLENGIDKILTKLESR